MKIIFLIPQPKHMLWILKKRLNKTVRKENIDNITLKKFALLDLWNNANV